MKLVFLRLAGIRYEGDNIGNDITLDVQAGDTFFSINKSVSAGSSATIGKPLAEFTATSDPFVIPISAAVTERDPVFNDTGRHADNFSVAMKGKRASVSLGDDKRSRLLTANPHTPPVRLNYSVSKQTLSTQDGTAVYSAISDDEPVTPGTYDLEIPDAPHQGGLHYPEAPHARTWFRIGHRGDRYLHPGHGSLGCVTVTETARWEELYDLLIVGRKGDGISVGILRVVK